MTIIDWIVAGIILILVGVIIYFILKIERLKKLIRRNREKKILYIDLDGVCADFEKRLYEICPTIDELERDEREDKIEAICNEDPNFFQDLEPIEGAIENIKELMTMYEVYFLSTPMWSCNASFSAKHHWVIKHFGELATKRLTLTHRKDLSIGAFLIDDRIKNGVAGFQGEHIHFGTKDFPNWKVTFDYLEKEFLENQRAWAA